MCVVHICKGNHEDDNSKVIWNGYTEYNSMEQQESTTTFSGGLTLSTGHQHSTGNIYPNEETKL